VNALTPASLASKSTPTRKVEVKEQLPPQPEVIFVTETLSLGGDVKAKKAKLTRAFEEAELRMSEAASQAMKLDALRKDLMSKVADLDDKIGAQRQIIDESNQAMEIMLSLVDAPDSIIDMVL